MHRWVAFVYRPERIVLVEMKSLLLSYSMPAFSAGTSSEPVAEGAEAS